MCSIKRIITCGAVILAIMAGFSCSESPVEPQPKGPEGYKVYFHSIANPEQWFTYNPETDFLDTLTLPTPEGSRAAISPDGDRLYLGRMVDHGLLVIDLETKELITELPYGIVSLDLSPDGSLLAFGLYDFNLVNTSDMSLAFHADVRPLTNPTFSRDGNYLLGGIGWDGFGWTTVADPATVVEEPISVGFGITLGGRILTSPVTDHWYLFSRPFFFVDWDVQADTAVFVDTAFSLGYYFHYITRAGKYVAYRNDYKHPNEHTEIKIYDTQLQQIVDIVDHIIYHESGDSTMLGVDELVITPDSKWLVGISHYARGYFMVYNLEELKIERFVKIPDDLRLINLVCQTGE